MDSLDKETMLGLMSNQLLFYGLESAASLVSAALDTAIEMESSNKLGELAFYGSMKEDGDEIIETIEQENIVIEDDNGLVIDQKEKYKSNPAPEFTCWYTSQHREGCTVSSISRDGRYAATGSKDASIKIIDIQRIHSVYLDKTDEKAVVKTLYDHTARINDIKFHPNGKLIASCSDDCTIKLYDLTRTNVKKGFRTLFDVFPVNSIDFHPSGDYLLAGTGDKNIRLWDIHSIQCYSIFGVSQGSKGFSHNGPINMVQYVATGSTFGSCSDDGTIKMWDASNGKCINTINKAHLGKPVTSIKFSRNGRYLLSSGKDSIGRLWDLLTGRQIVKYEGVSHPNSTVNMTFSQNEDYVLGTDEMSFSVACWDTKTGELLKKFPAHSNNIQFISTSPFESGMFTCSDDNRVKYWNITI